MTADDLRILTVRQPWAWAIIHGGKDVENRVRSLGPYRGVVAIHAGLTDDWDGHWNPLIIAARPGLSAHSYRRSQWRYGAIIGLVNLNGGHTSDECYARGLHHAATLYRSDRAAFDLLPDSGAGGLIGKAALCSPWAMGDHHHLGLSNPRPITPIPAKGKLGLWKPDPALKAAILAADKETP